VEKSAKAAGVDPKSFTDRMSKNFFDLCAAMNFSNDDFIRTTEPRHIASCQAIWKKLVEKGDIYLGSYAGWYAVRDEAFYVESELVNGKAPTGADVEWVEEPSYFFRLSAWADRLLEFYEKNPDCIAPASRRNEVLSFVKGGLNDLSVSRTSFSWGVPVPGDEKHVMYVWLDALTNYITAAGYPDVESEKFKKFWPADLHMVGKDILRFHTVYWHAFLMAAGVEPPKRVFAHGWWTNEGQKISKSVGNVIDPHHLVAKYGLDQTRYFLLREVPFGNDGDFSHRAMLNRMNSELANDFGNLAQRVLSMVNKNCEAKVPAPGPFNADDEAMLGPARGLLAQIRPLIERQAFNDALEALWVVIRAANAYVDHQAPWGLKKTDPARMNTVLYVLIETVRRLAILAQPFMPDTMARMLDQLVIPADQRSFAEFDVVLVAGIDLPKPEGVFPRLVESEEGA
jgi:methionyl-tRNA synthetase